MSETTFAGAPAYRLANDHIELFIARNVGPRIIGLRPVGSEDNILKVYPDQLASPVSTEFQLYGGHRLWTSPEIPGFTDEPDGSEVTITLLGGSVKVSGQVSAAQLEKSISVWIEGSLIHLEHTIGNASDKPVTVAPWALTVMEAGGIGVAPQAPFSPHSESLTPARPLVLWPYTVMDDPRVRWGRRMIRLTQDAAKGPFKYGAWLAEGTAGYWRNGLALIKKFPVHSPEALPDYGCNFETFTREDMLEVESLGATVTLEPGQTVSHPETWGLFPASVPPAGEDEGREWLDGLASQVKPWF